MANTYVDLAASAGTGTGHKTFSFNFPYLDSTHIKVELDGVNTTAFTIQASPLAVVLDATPTATNIRIRRDSDASAALVDFTDGSVLVENDLDKAYLHNLYLNEEIDELNNLSLQKAAGSDDWDAKGNKITNVGEPTLTTDAGTKNYVDTQVAVFKNGVFTEPLKYTFDGDGSATVFTFSSDVTLSADTLYDVNIDGVAQEPKAGTSNGSYSVNPDNDTITFTSAPPNSSRIVVIVRGYSQAVSEGSVNTDTIVDGAVTVAKIADSTITTAKISSNAAIELSKLEDVASGNIVVGSDANKATAVAMSGDATISNTGVVTVANITNAKVATTAAIAHAKLANTSAAGVLGSATVDGGTVTTIAFGAVTQDSNSQISTTKQIKTYVDSQVASKDHLSELSGDTDDVSEGLTNLYYTEARVTANTSVAANTAKTGITTSQASAIAANTAKNSYPSADATKLTGIATGAEVNVQTDWDATSGAASILNKPTEIGVADNAVTAAKISDSDTQFLVDDGSTKKVVVNEGAGDVDFTVKGDTKTLISCDAGNDKVTIGANEASDSAYNVGELSVTGNGPNTLLYVENSATTGNKKATIALKARGTSKIRLIDSSEATDGNGDYTTGLFDIASDAGALKTVVATGTAGEVVVSKLENNLVTFNPNQADVDFSVKGTSGNLIQTDAGLCKVVINHSPISTDAAKLTVSGGAEIKNANMQITKGAFANDPGLRIYNDTATSPNQETDLITADDGTFYITKPQKNEGETFILKLEPDGNSQLFGQVGIGVAPDTTTGVDFQLKVNKTALIQHTSGLGAASVYGTTGAALTLYDQSSGGEVWNVSSNKDSLDDGHLNISHMETPLESPINISSISISGSDATLNFSSSHNSLVNDSVVITGTNNSSWNGSHRIIEGIDSDSLKIYAPNSTVPSAASGQTIQGRKTKVFSAITCRRTTSSTTAFNDLRFSTTMPKSSSGEPSGLQEGQLWIDTSGGGTSGTLKIKL
jgi:hypothetical protein